MHYGFEVHCEGFSYDELVLLKDFISAVLDRFDEGKMKFLTFEPQDVTVINQILYSLSMAVDDARRM